MKISTLRTVRNALSLVGDVRAALAIQAAHGIDRRIATAPKFARKATFVAVALTVHNLPVLPLRVVHPLVGVTLHVATRSRALGRGVAEFLFTV